MRGALRKRLSPPSREDGYLIEGSSAFRGSPHNRYSARLITAYLLATQGWEWVDGLRQVLQGLSPRDLLTYPQWVLLLQDVVLWREWRQLPPSWWLPLAREAYPLPLV